MDTGNLYSYRVLWSEDADSFMGSCAEFPNLASFGQEQGAVLQGIENLVATAVAAMRHNGEEVPEPLAPRPARIMCVNRLTPEMEQQLAIDVTPAPSSRP